MAVTFGYENLIPYIKFDGSSEWLPPGTPGIVTGNESWVESAQRGLTLGCWFKTGVLNTTQALISKWSFTAGEASYILRTDAGGTIQIRVSYDGTNYDSRQVGAITSTSTWYFACARWTSTTLKLWCDDETSDIAFAARAGIYSNQGTLYLLLGAIVNTNWPYTGKIAYPFLVQQALSDSIITNMYQQSRAMFNK